MVPVFRTRLTLIATVIAVLSLLTVLFGRLIFEPRPAVDSVAGDTFSDSALGHRALVDLLREVGVSVHVSRYETLARSERASLLVIAEPGLHYLSEDTTEEAWSDWLSAAGTDVLLVLPRWEPRRSFENRRWVDGVLPIPEAEIEPVLRGAGLPAARVHRAARGEALHWQGRHPFTDQTLRVDGPQLIVGADGLLDPLIWTDEGTLLGVMELPGDPNGRLFILSDPDIIANHGLHREDNGALAIRLIDYARAGDGIVLLDETLHGHELSPSLARMLREFPLVLVVIQVSLFFLFWLWAGVGRFGAPVAASRELEEGNLFFIQNTAELLRFGRHDGHMVHRYVEMTLARVAAKLNAPDELRGRALLEWLEGMSRTRGTSMNPRIISLRALDMALSGGRIPQHQVLQIAAQIYRWKREILDGTRSNTRH